MEELPEISELATFVATAESHSISKAARTLGVPRPTLSRRLARLEERLGVRLLKRNTRSMTLTDAGSVLYTRARVVLSMVRDAVESVALEDDAVRGVVRVSVPPMGPSVGQLAARFLDTYPDARLEIDASTRHVDLLADPYDVAIRASQELPPGLIARNIAWTDIIAVASPSYLKRAGTPKKAADLAAHMCLSPFARGEHPATSWPRLRGADIKVEPVLASNDMNTLRAAAAAGRGIALLPRVLVHRHLGECELVHVLPQIIGAKSRLDIVYAERELMSPAVRAFVEMAVEWGRNEDALENGQS